MLSNALLFFNSEFVYCTSMQVFFNFIFKLHFLCKLSITVFGKPRNVTILVGKRFEINLCWLL